MRNLIETARTCPTMMWTSKHNFDQDVNDVV